MDETINTFKRIQQQLEYICEVVTSDRSLERKKELVQSAEDMLARIVKEAPPHLTFPILLTVTREVIQSALHSQQNRKYKHIINGADFGQGKDDTTYSILNKGKIHFGVQDKEGDIKFYPPLPPFSCETVKDVATMCIHNCGRPTGQCPECLTATKNNTPPRNDGSQCVCKWYPAECRWCSDMVRKSLGE